MSKSTGLIVLCCAALCGRTACSGQEVISIGELFRLADESSTLLMASEAGTDAADEALKAARAQRYPEIGISASASFLGNGRIWDRDFSNGMKIDIPHFGNSFSVEASQVIYAGGAIESGIRMASLQKQMSGLGTEKDRQDLRFLILGYYLDLYKLRNQIRVLEKNIALTEQVIGEMRARQEQGTVLKNDITRYELQKETLDLQLTTLRNTGKVLNYRIVVTLHLPEDTIILPDTTILAGNTMAEAELYWQEKAEAGNIDLKQSELNVRMKEQNLKMERSARLPQIAVTAGDHLDGPVTIEVPALNNNFNWWYVGIGVKYNLSSLYRSRNRVRQARHEIREAEETYRLVQENVRTSVQAGYIEMLTSFSDLKTQEKAVELADENYEVVSNRYENDLALLTDMLDASNMKLSADLALENARINTVYCCYKMKYLSHTL